MSPQILIVEDQAPLAEAMAKLLARQGLAADVSLDGVSALSRYAEKPYDLLIVDLQLPRISGVEVIRKIRTTNRGRTIPIMIVTGVYKGSDYAARARAGLGIKYYLEKPFKQEEFLAAVNDSLGIDAALPAAKAQPARPASPPAAPAATPAARPLGATERAPARPGAAERIAAKPAPAAPAAPAANGPRPLAEIQPQKALRGRLKDRPFETVLLDARKNRILGMLYLKRNGEERRMLFLNGLPADLRSTKLESSFGASLFGQGRISLMEYQVYQTQKPGPNPDEIFIKMGCLSPNDYFAAWRAWFEESLAQMCGWPDAEFTFQIWPRLPLENDPQSVNLARVVHQGFKKYTPAERVAAFFERSLLKFPTLAPAYYDHQMSLEIEPAEAVFLDRADGVKRVRELLPADPAEVEKLKRTLGAFVALGMLELRDRPEPREVEAPFPIRERVADSRVVCGPTADEEDERAEAAAQAAAAPAVTVVAEGFDDLIDDLENTLDDIGQVPLETPKPEPTKPAPVAAKAEPKPEARPAAAPAPAPAAKPAPAPVEDDQAKRETELEAFLAGAGQKSYYEYFGMKPGHFDFTKLKTEYFRLTKLFSPEHFIMSSGEMLSKAEDALTRVATAYNTLSNVVSKEKYDEMLMQSGKGAAGIPGAKDHDRMQAEVAFQSGMAFLEMSDWDGAEKSLGEAAALAPNNADILANWAYAIFNKNRKSKSVLKRSHEIIAQALKIKPKCAPAFAYRGVLLLEEEKVALAEGDFRKALSINPRNRLALKGLKKIEAMKEGEKKGLFGRLMK